MRKLFFVALEVVATIVVIKWIKDIRSGKSNYGVNKRDPLDLKGVLHFVGEIERTIFG